MILHRVYEFSGRSDLREEEKYAGGMPAMEGYYKDGVPTRYFSPVG
jgi:hypothetical protein